MCDNIIDALQKVHRQPNSRGRKKKNSSSTDPVQVTDPHLQFILLKVLLCGRKEPTFFPPRERRKLLIPLLIDNILFDSDPGTQEIYPGANASGLNCPRGMVVPTVARIRPLSICLLYEVCRVQKPLYTDLGKPSLDSFRRARTDKFVQRSSMTHS